jgi:hypothetical protein
MTVLQRLARYYFGRAVRYLVAGDLCSIKSEGQFSVVKILSMGGGVVHVKLYKEKFRDRPVSIEAGALSQGSIDDPNGFGIGHLPLSRGTFGSWLPVRFSNEPVTDHELVWVQEWQKSSGRVWD